MSKPLKILIVLTVGSLLLFQLVKWFGLDRKNEFTQILPYQISYNFEGQDRGPEYASGWRVSFSLPKGLTVAGSAECVLRIRKYQYFHLRSIEARLENHQQRYYPVNLYKKRFSPGFGCAWKEVDINFKQPLAQDLERMNRIERARQKNRMDK